MDNVNITLSEIDELSNEIQGFGAIVFSPVITNTALGISEDGNRWRDVESLCCAR